MMNVTKCARRWVGISISFLEHNFATIRIILMVLGRIIEQIMPSVTFKNDN